MTMIFKAMTKKLLGAKYERLLKNTVFLALFAVLGRSSFTPLPISLQVFLLAVTVATFTVARQTGNADDLARHLRGQFMLPFTEWQFNLALFGAIFLYTTTMRSAVVLVLYLAFIPAVTPQFLVGFLLACLLGTAAALMSLAMARQRKALIGCGLSALTFVIPLLSSRWLKVYFIAAILLFFHLFMRLLFMKSIVFQKDLRSPAASYQSTRHPQLLFLTYLYRYLKTHRNYVVNALAFWGVAIFLAFLFGQLGYDGMMPLGLAVLAMNTPLTILLSGDKGLQKKVRLLPGQVRTFMVPYCLFLLCYFLLTYVIYLTTWFILYEPVGLPLLIWVPLFAAQAALLAVALEWYRPIQNWYTESDLWRHPRKYLVPAVLLLEAVAIAAFVA